MNSYLMELLANDRAESWRRQAQRARSWKNARYPATTRGQRSRGARFSVEGSCEATLFVDRR